MSTPAKKTPREWYHFRACEPAHAIEAARGHVLLTVCGLSFHPATKRPLAKGRKCGNCRRFLKAAARQQAACETSQPR